MGDGSAGGSTTTDENGDSGIAPEGIIEDAVGRYCEQFITCGCGEINPLYTTVEACIDAELQALNILRFGAEAGLTFDAECFLAFQERFYRLGCGTDWQEAGPRVLCNMSFGSKALGEACTEYENAEGDDCERGLFCWSDRCIALQDEYVVGDVCYTEYPYCEGEAVCLDVDDDGVWMCEALPTAGEPCLYDTCAAGLLCNDSACIEVPALGEPCGPADAPCDPCLACATTIEPATCELPEPGPIGAACSSDEQCAEGAWCNRYSTHVCTTEPQACWTGVAPLYPNVFEVKLCQHL